jgi:hypothetical protein
MDEILWHRGVAGPLPGSGTVDVLTRGKIPLLIYRRLLSSRARELREAHR